MDEELIKNHDFLMQARNFKGLQFGSIYPTDIDGLIEYKDKCFIFIETKHKESELPFGQRLALERLCVATQKSGKESVLFVSRHDCKGDIDLANTIVTDFYYKNKWYQEKTKATLYQMIDRFIKKVDSVEISI